MASLPAGTLAGGVGPSGASGPAPGGKSGRGPRRRDGGAALSWSHQRRAPAGVAQVDARVVEPREAPPARVRLDELLGGELGDADVGHAVGLEVGVRQPDRLLGELGRDLG